jgi:methyl-accepting chemotaxis protein
MVWRRRQSIVDLRQQVWFGLELVFLGLGFIFLSAFLIFIPPMSDWFGETTADWLLAEMARAVFVKWPMVLVAFAVLFVVGVLMAHRLAGPMKGLNGVLSAWMRGDRKSRVRFRRYDYLLPMMSPLNTFLESQEKILGGAEDLAQSVVTGGDSSASKKKAEALLELLKGAERNP